MSYDTDDERSVLAGLSAVIGQHADWLTGRDFLRLAERAAEGYFADVPQATLTASREARELLERMRTS